MKPSEFFDFAKKHSADMVDLKFVDMLGTWQHCSFPIALWNDDTFKEGLGFDASPVAHMWRTMIWPNNFL